MVQVAGMLRCSVGLALGPGPAVRQLVTLLPSLDAPSPGAEGAGCAKSHWDSDCLGEFSVVVPSLGLANASSLPSPAAACNGEELSPQLPPCSLSSVCGHHPHGPLMPLLY